MLFFVRDPRRVQHKGVKATAFEYNCSQVYSVDIACLLVSRTPVPYPAKAPYWFLGDMENDS